MSDIRPLNYHRNCLDVDHDISYLKGPGLVPWDPVNWPCMAVLFGIRYLVSFELLFRVSYSLRNLRGLYFWSLIAGAFGCVTHITGNVVKFFVAGVPWTASTILIIIGWWMMVRGQSLVLYSRIHLVVDKKIVIWSIRAMIASIFAICFTAGTTALTWANITHGSDPKIAFTFFIIERTQLCAFLPLEASLSMIYVVATWRVLRSNAILRVKRVVKFLIITNMAIIALDGTVLCKQFLNWYAIQATLKPAVYAVKLKLEFEFLNQLFFITNQGFSFVRDPRKQSTTTDLKKEGNPQNGQNGKNTSSTDSGDDHDRGRDDLSSSKTLLESRHPTSDSQLSLADSKSGHK
jgi:hypothetical protein